MNFMTLYKRPWMIKATLPSDLNIAKTTITEVYIVSVALEKKQTLK